MIYRVTNPDELTDLARACDMPPDWDGSNCLDVCNVLGWGEPLRAAFVFDPIDVSTAEGHVMVHPAHRGKDAVRAGREALSRVTRAGVRVIGITPKRNRPALWYALAIGMRYSGETHEEVFTWATP